MLGMLEPDQCHVHLLGQHQHEQYSQRPTKEGSIGTAMNLTQYWHTVNITHIIASHWNKIVYMVQKEVSVISYQ
jgi:hypothetical protein